MSFSVGIQHTQRWVQVSYKFDFLSKEFVGTRRIGQYEIKSKGIQMNVENEDGIKFKLVATFTLAYSKRIFCVYELLGKVKDSFLIEFDTKEDELGLQYAFSDRVTGLAEIPGGNIVVSVRDQGIWILSPKLEELGRQVVNTRLQTYTILSSFLKGFVYSFTEVKNEDEINEGDDDERQREYKFIYVECNEQEVSSYEDHELARYKNSKFHFVFHSYDNHFSIHLVDEMLLNDFHHYIDLCNDTGIIRGWFDETKGETILMDTNQTNTSRSKMIETTVMMPGFVSCCVEQHDELLFLVGYRFDPIRNEMNRCFNVPLVNQYKALLRDTENPDYFYAVKDYVVDHFRLFDPRQSIINACCQTLASTLDSSSLKLLDQVLPGELLSIIDTFLPHKWDNFPYKIIQSSILNASVTHS